ncbi:hypothetical protein FRB93_011135 [Tulasnella sp. JGI-2019a]|nr:hypothetical protein FRB93_011135 [Tulasnella sp. JGI-2019a]
MLAAVQQEAIAVDNLLFEVHQEEQHQNPHPPLQNTHNNFQPQPLHNLQGQYQPHPQYPQQQQQLQQQQQQDHVLPPGTPMQWSLMAKGDDGYPKLKGSEGVREVSA